MSNYSESYMDGSNENTSWYKSFSLIDNGSKVLDIGCSSGNFGEELIKVKNCIVDGIEIDKEDIKLSSKKLRKVYSLDVEKDEISKTINEKYDFVMFGDVLEHLKDPVKVLIKVKEILKPEGAVVFSVPNMAHMSVRLMVLDGSFSYGETGLLDKTHVHFFDRQEVGRVFSAAKYKIEKLDATHNDYPLELANKRLSKIGIKGTNKFKKLLSSPEASSYQFIGLARPANSLNKTTHTLPDLSPRDEIGSYVEQLRKNFDGLEANNLQLKDDLQKLQTKYTDAENSPLIFTAKLYKIKLNKFLIKHKIKND